jgi:hypothetical protein
MADRVNPEEKSRNITTFIVNIPIVIPFSGTVEDEKVFKELCKKRNIKKPTEFLRILAQRRLKNKSGIQSLKQLAYETTSFKKFKEEFINNYIEFSSENVHDNMSNIIRNQIYLESGYKKRKK